MKVLSTVICTMLLFSVLIYELIGPLLTKIALTKAGDITPKPESTKQHLSIAEVFADDGDDEE